jgi:hypothetical protein
MFVFDSNIHHRSRRLLDSPTPRAAGVFRPAQFCARKCLDIRDLAVHLRFTVKSPAVHCRQPRIARKWAQFERNPRPTGPPNEFRKRRNTMTKQVLAVAALAVVAAFAPTTSHAQVTTKAEVPFAFQAGEKTMAPGKYEIRRMQVGAGNEQLIQEAGTKNRSYLSTKFVEQDVTGGDARLVFHCYNHDCFLAEVWNGNGLGWTLFESKREKELAQNGVNIELAVVTVPLTRKA